jgi:hypothetical protein
MNTNTQHQQVRLKSKGSGCRLTDVEKVVIGAFALGTTCPVAIKDLTGVKKRTVKWVIDDLTDGEGWDVMMTLESQNTSWQGNLLHNQAAYPILLKKGVIA